MRKINKFTCASRNIIFIYFGIQFNSIGHFVAREMLLKKLN